MPRKPRNTVGNDNGRDLMGEIVKIFLQYLSKNRALRVSSSAPPRGSRVNGARLNGVFLARVAGEIVVAF